MSSFIQLKGIFHATQCTKVPIGASGSSIIRAKDWAFVGTHETSSLGFIFIQLHVYTTGISVFGLNTELTFRDFSMAIFGKKIKYNAISAKTAIIQAILKPLLFIMLKLGINALFYPSEMNFQMNFGVVVYFCVQKLPKKFPTMSF